jgi:hypothetical protein
MDPATVDRIISTALDIGAAVTRAVLAAIQAGDVSTLQALHAVLPDAGAMAAADLALVAQQRARAEAELPPAPATPGSER